MKRDWQKNLIFGLLIIGLVWFWVGLKPEWMKDFFRLNLPAGEADLSLGIILGKNEILSRYWYEIIKRAGVLHIATASGSNLSLLALVTVESLAYLIGRRRAIVIGILVILGYVNLIGFEAPVGRALMILLLFYWAQFLGRKPNLFRNLLMTLIVLLVIDWDIVRQVSFWLSITAYLGVISFGEIKIKDKKYRWINYILINIWICLWIWPATALIFEEINWLSIITNPLVLFGVEYIYFLGWTGVVAGRVMAGLGSAVLMLGVPFLNYFLKICEYLANLGLGTINYKLNILTVLGWYCLLAWWLFGKKNE